MIRFKHIAILVLLISCTTGLAQTKVKVLTRIIEKSYTYNNEFLLEIDAEKADIIIETHDGNNVLLTVKQTVKNASEKVAKAHLDAQQFIEHNSKERLFLKNYILFKDPKDKTGSIFKNEYTIKVPVHCHVKLKNTLGNSHLMNLKKTINIEVEYGKVVLENCSGNISTQLNLGELQLLGGLLNGKINTKNTNVKIQSTEGSIMVNCSFGSFSVFLNGAPLILDAITSYCETTVINKSEGSYSFNLETLGGKINTMEYNITKTSDGNQLKINPANDGVLPHITIKTTDSDINLY